MIWGWFVIFSDFTESHFHCNTLQKPCELKSIPQGFETRETHGQRPCGKNRRQSFSGNPTKQTLNTQLEITRVSL